MYENYITKVNKANNRETKQLSIHPNRRCVKVEVNGS